MEREREKKCSGISKAQSSKTLQLKPRFLGMQTLGETKDQYSLTVMPEGFCSTAAAKPSLRAGHASKVTLNTYLQSTHPPPE